MLDNQKKGFDKSALIGMLLIGAILVWMQFTLAPDEKAKQEEEKQKTEEVTSSEQPSEQTNSVSPFTKKDSNAVVQQAERKTFVLENDKIKLEIDSKGGRITSAFLKEYKTFNGEALNLIRGDRSSFGFTYAQQGKKIHTKDIIFSGIEQSGEENKILTLNYEDATGAQLSFIYKLPKDGYQVAFNVQSQGLKDQLSIDGKTKFNFDIDIPRQENNLSNEQRYSSVYYNETGEGVDNLSVSSTDQETIGSAEWVAFKDHYFATIVKPQTAFKNIELATEAFDDEKVTDFVRKGQITATLPVTGELNYAFDFYFVPNNFKLLKEYNQEFQYLVDLGWGIFGWINRFLVIELFQFLEGFNLGYGLIIFIMALVIKILLYPMTKKSYTSAAAMRVLKPQLDKIKEQYPDDQMKQQQEQMALYGKAGVSPLSGCLPLLGQMPILWALFSFFPSSIELRQQSFLWANDLSTYDSVFNLPFEIPFYGAHVSLFALLMAGSSFLQMIYNQQTSSMGDNEQAKMMKNMMYFMPIIFLGVMNSYPSALAYYYLIANLMTFGQQWWIRKNTDDAKILAKIEAKKAKNENGGGNRFQRRMEEMMKQQEELKKRK
jgi:YidC/Oxa1 family membrane protein insertase